MDGESETCSLTPRTSDPRWWQVRLFSPELVESVTVTIQTGGLQHFTIFVIQLLEGSNALYKPCSEWSGPFTEPRVEFECNEGKGHYGDFVYIRDERTDHEHLMLCEVEVRPYTRPVPGGVECEDPVSPRHGFTVLANYRGINRAGSVARVQCSPGYVLRGEAESQCGEDGRWERGEEPWCEALPCSAPPHLPGTTMERLNSSLVPGSLVLLQCVATSGRATSRCLPDGTWSPVSLDCEDSGWLLPPNIIALLTSISLLTFVLVLCVSIILARRRKMSPTDRRKLTRLQHSYSHGTKVTHSQSLLSLMSDGQEKLLSILSSPVVEEKHDTVMRKYSVKNTLYHKTSPVLVTSVELLENTKLYS